MIVVVVVDDDDDDDDDERQRTRGEDSVSMESEREVTHSIEREEM